MKIFVMPETKCPKCGYFVNAATSVIIDQKVSPGDLTVCAKCATALRFTKKFDLELIPQEDYQKLSRQEKELLTQARKFVELMNL